MSNSTCRLLAVNGLIAGYVGLGIFLENHQIITEPAYWALYGAVFGGVFIAVLINR